MALSFDGSIRKNSLLISHFPVYNGPIHSLFIISENINNLYYQPSISKIQIEQYASPEILLMHATQYKHNFSIILFNIVIMFWQNDQYSMFACHDEVVLLISVIL